MTTQLTGPGWYDDPDDSSVLRYFDGVIWTAHTAPRRSPTAEQSTIGRVVAPPSTPPGHRDSVGHDGSTPWRQPPGVAPSGPAGSPWETRRDVLPDGAVLAEWWRRLFARVLDSLLTGVLTVVVGWPFVQEFVSVVGRSVSATVEAAERGVTPPDQTVFATAASEAVLPITVIGLVVAVLYEVVFLVWRGATPGKMALGTQVRRLAAPGPLSVSTAARRQAISVAATVVGLVPIVGFLGTLVSVLDPAWLLWDPKRQALHDKVADTVVVIRPGR
ncbi:MAG: RDD family protein [Dermatophilaceae bacterium]